MKISECMTRDPRVVRPDQPIRDAAQFMLREDAGSMPVCDGDRLVGMITDRDIAVRAIADGRDADTPVREAMTDQILFCFEDDEVEDVALKMSDQQVRRMPVVSRDDKKLIGIVSLGDIAQTDRDQASNALEGATEPGGRHSQSR